ncbi:MAG: hypothetical protein ABH843_00870 [Candidatus Omnitrophota bacterium]
MKKSTAVINYFFITLFMICYGAYAQDVESLKDEFYDGIAQIIEHRMDEPGLCVKEVNQYYEDNSATVKQIREWSGVTKAHVTGSYSESRSISDSQMQGYHDEAEYAHKISQTATDGMLRYKEALQVFMHNHMIEGLHILTKAKELSR